MKVGGQKQLEIYLCQVFHVVLSQTRCCPASNQTDLNRTPCEQAMQACTDEYELVRDVPSVRFDALIICVLGVLLVNLWFSAASGEVPRDETFHWTRASATKVSSVQLSVHLRLYGCMLHTSSTCGDCNCLGRPSWLSCGRNSSCPDMIW